MKRPGYEMKFKTGDTVQLKSGGPAMTAVEAGPPNALHTPNIKVLWWDAPRGAYQSTLIHQDALKEVTP